MSKTVLDAGAWQAMQSRIGAIRPDSARLWGKMDAAQCLCHLADQFRMAFGTLPTADVSNFFTRTLMKTLVLWGMPAPKGKVQTAQEIDQLVAGTKPTTFEGDRATLLQLVEELRAKPEGAKFASHPFFGQLTKGQWGKLAWTHLDHHLKQFGC